ncbi:MAG: carboxypeptidase M32 [Sandaracinus sp.]|nr:carboxypeptidase M32 [Sandaracinus sp.]MCB9631446.1 carboxypeptidase M32 [Sandaracinus sp.]
MSESLLSELKSELLAISDLNSAAMVLEWDQSTYMPAAGADARGRQIALLGELAHARRTSPRMAELLRGLSSVADRDDLDGALVRRAHKQWERATCVPASLVSEIKSHSARSYVAWTKAKPSGDFAAVRPYLEKTVELSRRYADCFSGVDHVLDPLIDANDPGMTTATIRALFDSLRAQLVPIVQAIAERPAPNRDFLERAYPEAAQLAFGAEVARELGYDFDRGRQDLTVHPFMIRFATDDIRITTRVDPNDLSDALFGTIHEAGHAMYEQGIARELEGTPLGEGVSAGVHESQSRLWENLVGRSRAFWARFLPIAKQRFPEQLGDVDLDTFYRGINRVERSLVRTEADEVTYNLHVMLRFDLEAQLLEGTLKVADLPEAWDARMASDLGVRPPSPTQGCMQDVHWYCTTIGGTFQGYALGNVIAAQVFEAAREAMPDLDARLEKGDFASLRGWLTDNLYQHGARWEPGELVERATGKPIAIDAFVRHLHGKYGALYGISF